MADTLLFRGGSTADTNSANTTVADREIVIDTDTDEIVVGSAKKRTIMNGNEITIDSLNNVGIGTTSPADKLHISNGAFAGVIVQTGRTASGTGIGSLLFRDGNANNSAELLAEVGGALVAKTVGSERLNIDSSGNVKIIGSGTVSAPKIELNATGSIIAAGDVQVGGNSSGATGTTVGTTLDAEGAVVVRRASGDIWTGKTTAAGGSVSSTISHDGSATFGIAQGSNTTAVVSGTQYVITTTSGTYDWSGVGSGLSTTSPVGTTFTATTDVTSLPAGNTAATVASGGNITAAGKIKSAETENSDSDDTVVTKSYLETYVAGDGTASTGYVKRSGDNMTGNLTLGTDKITLDASDGNIIAEGGVVVPNNRVVVGNTGINDVFVGVDENDNNTTNIRADGSITARGNITIYGAGNDQISMFKEGQIWMGHSLLDTDVIIATKQGDTPQNFAVYGDGSLGIGPEVNNINTNKIHLSSEGRIAAAGSSSFGVANLSSNSSGGVVLSKNGCVYSQATGLTTQGAATIFAGQWGTSTVFGVKTDGSITADGTVTANGTVLTSDQRFKENITPANPQLADIKALGAQLKNFDWNADAPSSNGTRFLGLIAQEAETICPGIVKTIARTKQGAELTPEVVVPAVYETRTVPAVLDDEGEVVEAETTEQVLITEEQVTPATYEQLDDSYKGISHDALIMKLLGAVAELSAKVEALESA